MEFNYGCYLLDIRSCTDAGVAGYAPGTNKLRLIWAMLAKMAGSSEDQKQKKKKKRRERRKKGALLSKMIYTWGMQQSVPSCFVYLSFRDPPLLVSASILSESGRFRWGGLWGEGLGWPCVISRRRIRRTQVDKRYDWEGAAEGREKENVDCGFKRF